MSVDTVVKIDNLLEDWMTAEQAFVRLNDPGRVVSRDNYDKALKNREDARLAVSELLYDFQQQIKEARAIGTLSKRFG